VPTFQQIRICLGALILSVTPFTTAYSDVWVFEPSVALDQRIDDNFTISPVLPDAVNATRVVGTLGLSRESQRARFKGLVRIDGLVTQSEGNSTE